MHGGRRPGTGGRNGDSNQLRAGDEPATAAVWVGTEGEELSPLEVFLRVMRDEQLGLDVRLDAAKAAAPYLHRKQPVDVKADATAYIPPPIILVHTAPPAPEPEKRPPGDHPNVLTEGVADRAAKSTKSKRPRRDRICSGRRATAVRRITSCPAGSPEALGVVSRAPGLLGKSAEREEDEMGGTGSGWQWGRKIQVEECVALSAPMLQQRGLLKPDSRIGATLAWRHGDEAPFASYDLIVRTTDTGGELEVSRSGEPMPMHTIELATTPLPWGGLRWWFRCPMWRHNSFYRSAKLYLPEGANTFGCRDCYDLTYVSCQASHRPSRLHRAAERLLRKMGRC